jgi:hypothetical protein
VTNGKYTGTAAGDTDLAGAITLRVRSVVNSTDKVGTVNGAFRIEVSGRDTVGAFSSVYDNGAVAGFAAARAHVGHGRRPHLQPAVEQVGGHQRQVQERRQR